MLDSRKAMPLQSSLFFAIEGERHDGHTFIQILYKKGYFNFIVQQEINIENFPDANFLLVKDSIQALQQLTRHHRESFDIPVIGITGSNGKTIVKEWLFHLLKADKNIVRSPKSYNSQVGVPLSVWGMRPEHSLGIFEAGISQPGEMEKLETIIQPSLGLFTNIGSAHSEGFSGDEEKIKEKLNLFNQSKCLIYCKDDPLVDQLISEKNIPTFSWSRSREANLHINAIHILKKEGKTKIEGIFQNQDLEILIPFTDEASIENAIHCWATMLFLEYDLSITQERMKRLHPIALRLELKEGIHNCLLVNDSYNLDFQALEIALDFLNQQTNHINKTLIISDILQSGTSDMELYKNVAQLILNKGINRLFGIGNKIIQLKKFLPANFKQRYFNSTHNFIKTVSTLNFKEESILIKGARVFEFEKIANRLSRKAHKTVLEIDLNAAAHNLNIFRKHFQPSTQLMVMVKASAYGSGSYEVARLLEFQNVDYLAVAYIDEGVELRQTGIQLPIMVLNPEEAGFEDLLEYHLEPEIYSLDILKKLIDYVQKPISIHLKIDTGMKRLGFEAIDLEELTSILKNNSNIKIKSILSHLAASDDPLHDDFTQEQISNFNKIYNKISSILNISPLRHILNSAGIIRYPQHQMEMVRLGIGLYGIDPTGQLDLQPVSRLKGTISQIKHLNPGETTGYNRSGKAEKSLRIGTISLGYADGLPRLAGNGRFKVWINGALCPILGNVCMDMCMVDLSGTTAEVGDEVIVFGPEHPIEHLATASETIPYEILTNISERVKRVYFQE